MRDGKNTIGDRAVRLFQGEFTCAQAILTVFGERVGLSEFQARELGRGLGSGMGLGWTCGAVSSAALLIGLASAGDCSELEARLRAQDNFREFARRFEFERGATTCRELLGLDVSTETGEEEARRQNLFATICEDVIKNAVHILDETLSAMELENRREDSRQ